MPGTTLVAAAPSVTVPLPVNVSVAGALLKFSPPCSTKFPAPLPLFETVMIGLPVKFVCPVTVSVYGTFVPVLPPETVSNVVPRVRPPVIESAPVPVRSIVEGPFTTTALGSVRVVTAGTVSMISTPNRPVLAPFG